MRRFISAFALTASLLGASVALPSTAQADTVSVASYTPTQGEVIADVHGDFYELTLSFQLSQSQVDGLRATSEFLELDFVVYNVTIPGDSQDYQVYGNLPSAQQDVGFHDATFTPSVTMIQTSKLQANTHYWATVKFRSGATTTPRLSVEFVPSRWHSATDLIEWGACEVGKIKWNGAWCVFPVEGARVMLTANLYGGLVPIDGSHYSLDPSRLDFANIA